MNATKIAESDTSPKQRGSIPPFLEQRQKSPGLEAKLRPRPRFQEPNYRSSGKLKGKCALLTGGDSGIGRAVAVLFACEGADLALSHLPAEESDAVETEAAVRTEGTRCFRLPGDLTDRSFCRQGGWSE